MVSLPLVFQTTEEWLDSELGVHPVQVALQVRGTAGGQLIAAARDNSVVPAYSGVCMHV
jgi:hypothetical protein